MEFRLVIGTHVSDDNLCTATGNKSTTAFMVVNDGDSIRIDNRSERLQFGQIRVILHLQNITA